MELHFLFVESILIMVLRKTCQILTKTSVVPTLIGGEIRLSSVWSDVFLLRKRPIIFDSRA
jgi:hypothetical protein